MTASMKTIQDVYRVMRKHLKPEQCAALLADLAEVEGNTSFVCTVSALRQYDENYRQLDRDCESRDDVVLFLDEAAAVRAMDFSRVEQRIVAYALSHQQEWPQPDGGLGHVVRVAAEAAKAEPALRERPEHGWRDPVRPARSKRSRRRRK